MNTNSKTKGFTLLELLIVIAIIAILATIIVIIINPVEILRRARDVQRLSDLSSTRTAIALYLTTVTDPALDGGSNGNCKEASGAWPINGDGRIYYSYQDDINEDFITDANLDSADVTGVTSSSPADVAGGGWIRVDLGDLSGSSPLSHYPLDPVNTISDGAIVKNADKVYRYACRQSPLSFELNATLESQMYTEIDNKLENDGGNNVRLYEIGTRLDILGGNDNF